MFPGVPHIIVYGVGSARMGYLIRFQIRKIGISLVKVYERVGKSISFQL